MSSKSITIKSADGLEFDAYVARPAAENRPVVVVAQEIFGVNKVMRDIADWLAKQGFIAVVPDLFHRQEKGIQLTDQSEAEWARAFELYQGFNEDLGVEDLKCTEAIARKLDGSNGKTGTIGFCLGGKLAYLMSTRSQADANVSYYGVGIENNLNESPIRPLLLHIAAADQYVLPEAQEKIKAALKDNTLATAYIYPGQDHAFARVGGEHYNQEAAELAHKRTLEFFQKQIG